jgi:hypothetical protein
MGLRASLDPAPMPDVVHVYFHDTDLLDAKRRLALALTLRALGRRRQPIRLDELAHEAGRTAAEQKFKKALAR